MFPILISVSLAPVSYFFWASAALPVAATTARLRNTVAKRRWVGLGIWQNSLRFSRASRVQGLLFQGLLFQGLLFRQIALIQRKIMFARKSPLRRCRRGHDSFDYRATGHRSGSAADAAPD